MAYNALIYGIPLRKYSLIHFKLSRKPEKNKRFLIVQNELGKSTVLKIRLLLKLRSNYMWVRLVFISMGLLTYGTRRKIR